MAYLHEPDWQVMTTWLKRQIPSKLSKWLLTRQSTSQQFSHLVKYHYKVSLRNVGWQYPDDNELKALQKPLTRKYYWLRETDLYCDDKIVMYARAVVDTKIRDPYFYRLATLNSQPLGKLLHNDPKITRSDFMVCQLLPKHRLFQQATQHLTQKVTSLWARRSLFTFPKYSLLLTEVLLPDIESL